ncbi:LAMI_0F07052g1_1 [Lachancea mirantina]|uniref:Glutamate--tRNA ligase, mitochondrial n=1 Tax=Lachancea mirantina TaxID=1230905 RepID=A0A1G4JZE8_9SACH|nr:LAMI_0F07052g1_1 [Lachancea mirantina]
MYIIRCQRWDRRWNSSLRNLLRNSLSESRSLLSKKPTHDLQPTEPARTRFAPSPTGLLHIGSLRTALYNYLLAKSTGGQFLLRLEDTDQKRLVPGAEKNIYDSLRWCGISYDEGPGVKDDGLGPFRQSDRAEIYKKYIDQLLETGHAYRCFCPKERLEDLRKSAQLMVPPTTASYDRHCSRIADDMVQKQLRESRPFTIRMRSPKIYPPFHDLLHGEIDIQMQTNANDVRYDDPILMKSDGLPTYHFANVVDDHLMGITHVIRGEEWLPSTPKHIALYEAFGWQPPKFIHIPLLTSMSDKKLSKRRGDADVLALKQKGVLPEALVNFCVLFGWSPPRNLAAKNHECFTLQELVSVFNIDHLTKGNAKVDESKLWFFNKHYLSRRLETETGFNQMLGALYELLLPEFPELDLYYLTKVLRAVGHSLESLNSFSDNFYYLLTKPRFRDNIYVRDFLQNQDLAQVLQVLEKLQGHLNEDKIQEQLASASNQLKIPKKVVFETTRFALTGSLPGVKIQTIVSLLGSSESNERFKEAIELLKIGELSPTPV